MVEQRLHRTFFARMVAAFGLEMVVEMAVLAVRMVVRMVAGWWRKKREHGLLCTQPRRCACGQMTIECAICFPVLIALALVSYNAMSFICACSEFDRQFCEEVRIHASSLDAYSTVTSVCDDINEAMNTHYVPPENRIITAREQGLGIVRFTGEMIFEPTLFGNRVLQGMGFTQLPSLHHTISLACSCMKLDAL